MKKNKKWNMLSDNRFIFLISLLAAVLVWVVVAGLINPGNSKPLYNVPIDYERNEIQYRDRNLTIVTPGKDLYADVQVSGDGAVLASLDQESVSVYADYSLVTEGGTWEVPLRASKMDAGSWSLSEWSTKTDGHSLSTPHQMVTLTFEKMETKVIPITVKADGVTAAPHYFIDPPLATPESVTIRGPKSRVDLVSRVVAEVTDEEELTERKKYLGVAMTLLDANGEAINAEESGITMAPETVEVDVSVLVMRNVQLEVVFAALPANLDTEWFYERVGLSVDEVEVIGPASAFEAYADVITVGPFDATKLGMNWEEKNVAIQIPEGSGMRINDEQRTLSVYFDTTGLVEKTFEVPITAANVINGPNNGTVLPGQKTLTVKLMGTQEQMDTLLPENIMVEIDAFGISASKSGQQNIPARIKIPGADQCIPLGGYSIVCDVEPAAG